MGAQQRDAREKYLWMHKVSPKVEMWFLQGYCLSQIGRVYTRGRRGKRKEVREEK